MSERLFNVKEALCTACGACSSLAPGVFVIKDKKSHIARQPTEAEQEACEAALLNCPPLAIHASAGEARESQDATPAQDPSHAYVSLIRESEAVRWRLSEIPWERLNPNAATPALRALVREMAFSEHTTYSATARFMQAFYDNVDFTQWLAVWFYEETRHPHILMSWLRELGEPLDDQFVLRGRVSTPLMKSLTGTLVTNIISEMTAAYAYQKLCSFGKEPVLTAIAERLSGDEARHAAGFYRYAQKRISSAKDPNRERLDGLKVLHVWLNDTGNVTHPINQMIQRLERGDDGEHALEHFQFEFNRVRVRVVRLLGGLLGVPLQQPEDVLPQLQALIAKTHAQS